MNYEKKHENFISINLAYETIDKYLYEARIEFDLGSFSYRPKFLSLIFLLNQLSSSIGKLLI